MLREARNLVENREREITELQHLNSQHEQTIKQLESENAWLRQENWQLKKIADPGVAADEAHVSREILPPLRQGYPDYGRWARLVQKAIRDAVTADDLQALAADNDAHLSTLETEVPGTGVALRHRIDARRNELQKAAL